MEKEEKKQKAIVLESTFRGLTGDIVARISGIIGLLTLLQFGILNWAHGVMAKYGATSFWGYCNLAKRTSSNDDFVVTMLGFTGCIVILAVVFVICNLISTLYGARNRVYLEEGKIISTEYSFPFKKTKREKHFNQITRADVYQNSFARLLGTGTLVLELITYTNADSRKTRWGIPYIVDPDSAQAAIMSAMPEYTGLLVKTSIG